MSEFCTRCGHGLAADDAFCAKCGTQRGVAAPAPASTQAPSPGGKSSVASMIVGISLLTLMPLLFFGTKGGCTASTEGQVDVRGGPRPAFTLRPTTCDSMQPFGRFGASLHGEGTNDGALYVTTDPTRGTSIEVEVPGSCRNADGTDCTVFPLPREACRTFEAHVEFNGVVVNDVRQVEGHLSVDCTLPDGTVARGRITFGGC